MPRIEDINYSKLPEHCREGVKHYIEEGVPLGHFLTAVFSNQLVEAFGLADPVNTERMRDYADFLYNEAPSPCWGSKEIVAAWLKKHSERRAREDANASA